MLMSNDCLIVALSALLSTTLGWFDLREPNVQLSCCEERSTGRSDGWLALWH